MSGVAHFEPDLRRGVSGHAASFTMFLGGVLVMAHGAATFAEPVVVGRSLDQIRHDPILLTHRPSFSTASSPTAPPPNVLASQK